ncbi:hypothetical protein P3S40_25620 [Enterobacter hormaechei]|nr:hypothetical protein [Enterobacter hormaechei]MDF3686112.1 hypothetical protein [Enterobacter hormaechei]
MKIWSFDTMLKLMNDKPHSSQESPICKHLSQKERSKKIWRLEILDRSDVRFFSLDLGHLVSLDYLILHPHPNGFPDSKDSKFEILCDVLEEKDDLPLLSDLLSFFFPLSVVLPRTARASFSETEAFLRISSDSSEDTTSSILKVTNVLPRAITRWSHESGKEHKSV